MAVRTGSVRRARPEVEGLEKARAESPQDAVALGRGDEDVLLRHVGNGPDDRQHVVELLHADFAVDDGDTLLAGLLGEPKRGDRAAEQQQRLGHVLPGGPETSFIAVPRPAEQSAHVFLKHRERHIGEPGLKAGGLGHEHGCPPRRFQIDDVLHRHDRPFADQAVESVGMDSPGVSATESQATCVFEAVEKRDDVGGGGRLRVIAQPSKAGATKFGIDRQQLFEHGLLGGGQTVRQDFENLLPGARPCRQPDPFQHVHRGEKHVVRPQMGDHRLDDRLPAVSGPGGIRTSLQAGTPISEPEGTEPQKLLKFDHMLAAGFRPARVVAEEGRIDTNLLPDKGKHRLGRQFRWIEGAARMTERAKLDSEAQAVDRSSLRQDQDEVFGAEDEVTGHFGGIDREGEQPGALLGRQQGTTWHGSLDLVMRRRS
jgi:hypothetical protein